MRTTSPQPKTHNGSSLQFKLESLPGARTGAALLLTLLLLLPVLLVPIVPTQDGPFHLVQAQWLALVGWQGALPAPVATFLEWNPRWDPYLGVYPFLAGMLWSGMEPLLAYKTLFVLYAVLWVGATGLAARGSQRPFLAVLLCAPLAFGQFLHAGYLNYVLGLIGFFAFAALHQQTAHIRPLWRNVLLGLGALVLAFTHLVAVVAALLYLAAEALSQMLSPTNGQQRPSNTQVASHALGRALALSPALAMVLSFVWATRHQQSVADAPLTRWPVGLKSLLTSDHLVAFHRLELVWVAACLFALLGAGVCAWRLRHHAWSPRARQWGLFTALALLVVVLDIRNAQGVSLSERLVPLVWAGFAFTLAERLPSVPLSSWARYGAGLMALAWLGLAGQTVTRSHAYLGWVEPQQAVWRAGLAHPQRTFVSAVPAGLERADQPAWRVQPLLHANQLAAVAAQGVGLSSPVNSPRIFGYAPIRYRADSDWFAVWPNWEGKPQVGPTFGTYRQRYGGAPHVLLVWGDGQAAARLATTHGFSGCMDDHSVFICTVP